MRTGDTKSIGDIVARIIATRLAGDERGAVEASVGEHDAKLLSAGAKVVHVARNESELHSDSSL